MGYYHWTDRRLTHFNDTDRQTGPAYDIGDAVEAHGILKVTNTGGSNPSLAVKAEHSIDGLHWEDLTGLTFSSATDSTVETSSASINTFRYIRFVYDLSGTAPTITFELIVFVKTRSVGAGGAPPVFTG